MEVEGNLILFHYFEIYENFEYSNLNEKKKKNSMMDFLDQWLLFVPNVALKRWSESQAAPKATNSKWKNDL